MIIKVKKDCVSGECIRYTVGKPGDTISRALYIKKDFYAPDEFTLTLIQDDEKKAEVKTDA